MAAGSMDVVVRFIGDASSIQNEAAKVEGTGSKLKAWAKGVGTAIGIAFAADQLRDWIGAASNLNESMNKVTTVFGKSAKSVQNFAKTASTNLGLSQQEALDAAGAYGNMFVQLGFTSKGAADMSKSMLTLTADIASFHNVDPTQVLEAQQAAFRGEYDALQRFIPTISAATVETKALAMTGKTNADQLTAQEKAAATYQLMMEGAGSATGDFARTADSAANQQRIMNAQWKDAQAQLGQALLPVLQAILPILSATAGFIKDNADWLVPLAAAIIGVVAAIKLWIAVQTVIDALLAANPIGLVVIAVAALVAAIVALAVYWDEVWSFIANLPWYLKVVAAILFFASPIAWLITAIAGLAANWDAVWAAITDAVNAAADWIGQAATDIAGFFSRLPGQVAGALSSLFGIITSPFVSAWNFVTGIANSVMHVLDPIVGIISSAVSGVTHAITAPFEAAWSIIQNIAGIISGAVNTAKSAYNTFARTWNAIEVKLPEIDLGPLGSIGGGTVGLPDLPLLAKGGIVTGPTLAILGERGPEAVIPLNGSSGVGATFNINVTVGAGANPADAGRAIVDAIRSYERVGGKAWRN